MRGFAGSDATGSDVSGAAAAAAAAKSSGGEDFKMILKVCLFSSSADKNCEKRIFI